jgi:hypothetical protein
MKETDFYPEITEEMESLFRSNIDPLGKDYQCYFINNLSCVNLKKGLDILIAKNSITCKSLLDFAKDAPPIKIDIFGVVIFGDSFKLLICEIKYTGAVGLTELSQLIGYCIASDANYGILINVDASESADLTKMLVLKKDICDIVRLKRPGLPDTNETKLGVMNWQHSTKNLIYSNLGAIRNISALCDEIQDKLSIENLGKTFGS